MQRIIEEYTNKTVVDPDSYFGFIYRSVHNKVARDVPFVYFQDCVQDITDFPEIMHVAEEMENRYKKIETNLNEIL